MGTDEALAWAHANLPGDPSLVVSAMESVGWVKGGGRAGEYVRMTRPAGGRPWIIVPLDPTAPEYTESMAGVLAELKLAADAGWRAQQVLDALPTTEEGEQ